MPSNPLDGCPPQTIGQLTRFVARLESLLAKNLLSIYLHGSLAMGCFNPRRSDLDILVVSRSGMQTQTKRRLAGLLLRQSNSPHPIEISFLSRDNLSPWRYPTPYDFHYSEDWRKKTGAELRSGEWRHWNKQVRYDPDLAAHITITRQRGVLLSGSPISTVLPEVPAADYLASIMNDTRGFLEGRVDDPVYAVLNICRVYAFKRDGLICSKREGGEWGLAALPAEFQPLVGRALEIYGGEESGWEIDKREMSSFLSSMREALLGRPADCG